MAALRELRDALRDVSLKGMSLGLERVCRLAVVVASARILGEAAFGRFVFASTVTTLLALGTDLGLGVWTTRALARRADEGASVVRVGLALRGAATIPYAVAVAAIAVLAGGGEVGAAIALLGVAAVAGAFVDYFGAVLRGRERFAEEARLNASRAGLTLVAGLTGLSLGRSLAALCAGLAAANVASLAQGWAAMARLHPLQGSAAPGAQLGAGDAPGARALATAALRESLPIWLAGLLSILYFKVDTLFLRAMAGDTELGAYGAAYKFFEGSMAVPAVLLAVAFPRLARAHGNPPAQRRLEGLLALMLLALGALAGSVCLTGGGLLVRGVFGPEFAQAILSLRVLALGLPLVFLNYGLTHFLLARDMGRATLWLSAMMLALNVALCVALIPRWSGPGAAWATVLSEVALSACCLAALRRAPAPVPAPTPTPTSTRATPKTGPEAA